MSIHHYYRRIPSLIQDATIPIYYASKTEGPLIPDRSGVLIQVGNRRFLATTFRGWCDEFVRDFNDGGCLFTSSGEIAFDRIEDRHTAVAFFFPVSIFHFAAEIRADRDKRGHAPEQPEAVGDLGETAHQGAAAIGHGHYCDPDNQDTPSGRGSELNHGFLRENSTCPV